MGRTLLLPFRASFFGAVALLLTHRVKTCSVFAATTCAVGTSRDNSTDSCVCDANTLERTRCHDKPTTARRNEDVEGYDNDAIDTVYIAGLFDTDNFGWGESLFHHVVDMINDRTDGWYDHLFSDGATIMANVSNSMCDPDIAARKYWDLKTSWGSPLHGVVGCRCSGASMSVARIAGLENVPQVSMSSSSSKLSNTENFPSFFQTVAPADHRGDAGALAAMFRSFCWDRVSVINTDTQYTNDIATDFTKVWADEQAEWGIECPVTDEADKRTGKVAYSRTIKLNSDGTLDDESVTQALEGIPSDDPRVNSRIILLLAHSQHSFGIIKRAADIAGLHRDIVWVGSQGWANRTPKDRSWMPTVPGYLGLVPHQNRDWAYQEFLEILQRRQRMSGQSVMDGITDWAVAMLVDSVLSMATAISTVPPDYRSDGRMVVSALTNVNLNGTSGEVSFTAEGDRANPKYDIVNLAFADDIGWKKVGTISLSSDMDAVPNVNVGISDICWAVDGCSLASPQSDKYPVPPPPEKVPIWVAIVIPLIALVVVALSCKYWRSKRKKKLLKSNIDELQGRLKAMNNIDDELVGLDKTVEDAKAKQQLLIMKRFALQGTPTTWSDAKETLVEVPPDNEQYWQVCDKLKATMDNAWISKLWRVQNKSLWTFYSFHKDRLAMHGVDHNERSAWHGTSSLDPSIIYNDQQDGFMMQFSSRGFWGRGIYFADKSVYSHSYSYNPSMQSTERPKSTNDEREMFLVNLLRGNEIFMDRDTGGAKANECKNLTAPPPFQARTSSTTL